MAFGTLLAAGCVFLAACGGGGSKVASAANQSASTASPTTATVLKTSDSKYGSFLTDAKGFALYTYTADHVGRTGCTGACLKYWPPLLLPPGVSRPIAGPGVSGLGTFKRSEGTQVTYKGLPLYTYVTDAQPGQVTGQNFVDSGGKWILATIGSPKVAPSSTASTHPAATVPAVTSPPATQAPVTQAPMTQAPVTQAPLNQPPMTSPPVTAAPVTSPPPTRPPVTNPPPTTPRITPPTTAPGGGPTY